MFIQGLMLQFKLFFRNKYFRLLYIFILLGISISILSSVFINPLISFYNISQSLFYYGCLFSVIALAFFIYAKRIGLDDIVNSVCHKENSYQILTFIVMFILLIFINLVILVSLYIDAYFNHQVSLYINVILNNYMMNIFLPLFISLVITFILSCLKNYRLSVILLGLIFILTSPFMELFEFRYPLFMSLDRIIYYIHLPFSYFIQNMKHGIDSLYGFQNEVYKLSITLFWSLLALVVFYKCKKKVIKIMLYGMLGFAFASIYIPQSISRLNNSSFGTYADYNYYNIDAGGGNYQSSKKDNYYISQYILHINLNRQLSVSGNIEIKSNDLRNEFELTLYHGYKVKNITGKNLKYFKIDGDTIYLKFNRKTRSENIVISYSGYSHNLYSNYQAVMLPGYFPWYPMAGTKQVYITMNDSNIGNQGYNPYNRIPKANFEIYIDEAHYPIIVNLPKKSEEIYGGSSDSLTLVGGNMLLHSNNQFMNSLLWNIATLSESNVARMQAINDIKEYVKIIFNYDANFLNKKIIVFSNILSSSNQYSGYAEFENYLTVPGNNLNISDVLYYYVYRSSINPVLKDAIILNKYRNISTKVEFINELLLRIDNDIEISKNAADEKRHQDGIQAKKEIKEHIKNYCIEDYMTKLGKDIFGEEE